MKEPFSFTEGRIVQSIQGRDAKAYFIVLNVLEDGFVAIADGDRHKLSHPKRKKTKHLRAKPVLLDLKNIRPEGGRLQDSDLRKALEQHGFAQDRSLCKEG
jgi:ribosomal protein L14E/L6E/L27E